MTPGTDLGIVRDRRQKSEAIIAANADRLSQSTLHALNPRKYARPVPFERGDDSDRQELHRLRLENTNLRATVAGLQARIESMQLLQDKMASQICRKITITDAFPKASVDQIIKIVAKHWDTDPGSLRAPIRVRRFVRPRQAAYRLLSELLHLSFPNIGRCFNRDHTTVMHGLHSAQRLLESDADWRMRYEAALAELKSAGGP